MYQQKKRRAKEVNNQTDVEHVHRTAEYERKNKEIQNTRLHHLRDVWLHHQTLQN